MNWAAPGTYGHEDIIVFVSPSSSRVESGLPSPRGGAKIYHSLHSGLPAFNAVP